MFLLIDKHQQIYTHVVINIVMITNFMIWGGGGVTETLMLPVNLVFFWSWDLKVQGGKFNTSVWNIGRSVLCFGLKQ